MTRKAKIAVGASKGVGDGLIALVLANNLIRNNYDVTFFSNKIVELQDWFPSIPICAYPKTKEEIDQIFRTFDLTIADAYSDIIWSRPKEDYDYAAKHYVFFALASLDPQMIFDQSNRLKQEIKDEELLQKLLPLARSTGTRISLLEKNTPAIYRVEKFCREYLNLKNTTRENGITIPAHFNLTHRKYLNRIVIHPTSSDPIKNWPAYKFISLAHTLKKEGFDPIFIVSMQERPAWIKLTKENFALPQFPSLNDTAAYIYESGVMIGNDSGIGHLASNLEIPTLTIIHNNHKYTKWRPAWTYGKVVPAIFSLSWINNNFWHWSIPKLRVLHAFHKLLEDLK